jgi:hypothetical protein
MILTQGTKAAVADRDKGGGSRVLSRSSTKPIFVALGTATVLTLSAVTLPATAAVDPGPTAGDDPGPDPSDSPPASDPPPDTPPPDTQDPPDTQAPPESSPPYQPSPSLTIRLTLSAGAAAAGGSVTATARVSAQRAVAHHTVLRFSASSASVSGPISLGDLDGERSVSGVVRTPTGHGTDPVMVTASLSADRASTRSATGKIKVTDAGTAKTADPGGGEPLSPSMPVPSMPVPSMPVPSMPVPSMPVPGLPVPSMPVPGLPGTAAAMGGGPAQAQLPMIAQRPPVTSAELPAVRPVSLRTRATPIGLDATFYRLLWIQVAWLTALLVGVSLLLTRLRLNRRRLPARAATGGSRRRASGGRRSGRP